MTEKIRILAVLPYEGLKEQLLDVAAAEDRVELNIIVTSLDDAVRDSKRALARQHYDALISRGGTAERLRKELKDIEIVDIQVDFSDVFRAVIMARNYTEKFAIQSYPAIAEGAMRLCRMLQYNIDVYTIHSPEESFRQLKELRDKGYTMIVGDVTTSAMAKEVGMNAILIMSGADSIKAAINQVIQLESVKRKVQKSTGYLDTISDTMPLFVAMYDEKGERIFTNDARWERFPAAASYIEKHSQRFVESDELDESARSKEKIVVVNTAKEMDENGETITVVYGKEVNPLNDEENGIILEGEEASSPKGYMFRSFFGVANSVGESREAIIRYCNAKEPILILGEVGSGKDTAAASLHSMGYNKKRPYYLIDCAVVSGKQWNRFFKHSSSPLMDVNCTIYFKNLQQMSTAQEANLIELIEHTNLCRRNQVIFSAAVREGEEMCSMAKYLLEMTSCVLLQAMPLRKRTEDIVSICTMYIMEMNAQNGTQILGLDRDAMEIVKNYSWPGNVIQLKRILSEAVMMTDGDYITGDTVSRCIYNETFSSQEVRVEHIDPNQSLDDMTYDIVRMVLKEEGMNRQRTADRLKISRTTLWRILKSRDTD